jgi:hypothetical protein
MVFDLRPELVCLNCLCAGERVSDGSQCHSVLGYDVISDWIEIAASQLWNSIQVIQIFCLILP